MPRPLSQAAVNDLHPAVAVPAYTRSQLRVGVVHLGVGAFHRAHQAMYLDALLQRGGSLEWGICGVGVLPQDRRTIEGLRRQDGLYTLVLKHPDGRREPRVVGSLVEAMLAPDDPEAVLTRLADPAVRVVTLTITEGGYLLDPVTGELQVDDPGIRADLRPGATPSTAFGYLTEGLARRRAHGIPPFTVLSCDNLPHNGDVTRRALTAFARLKDADLADWVESQVAFPSCMVDRITPVTVPDDVSRLAEEYGVEDAVPVVCEPYAQWVVEDAFPAGRPPLEDVGVELVADVEPYELMKLRLLNGSHQAIAYLGQLAGYRYAHEVCSDPAFVRFVLGYMEDEASPTLPALPGVDLPAYRRQLVQRFANPQVRDALTRLAGQTSDRIPKWLVPVIRHNLRSGGEVRRCALVVASWARYAEGVDEHGGRLVVVDRLEDRVVAAAARQVEDPLAFVRDRELFGDLAANERFAGLYLEALRSLRERGAAATVAAWA